MEGAEVFIQERLVVPKWRWLHWGSVVLAPLGGFFLAGVAIFLQQFSLFGVTLSNRFVGYVFIAGFTVSLGALRVLVQRVAGVHVTLSTGGVTLGKEVLRGALSVAYAWHVPDVAQGEAKLKELTVLVYLDEAPVMKLVQHIGEVATAPDDWERKVLPEGKHHFSVEGTNIELPLLATRLLRFSGPALERNSAFRN